MDRRCWNLFSQSPLTVAYDRPIRRPPDRSATLPDKPAIAAIASERLIMALIFSADVRAIDPHKQAEERDGSADPAFVLVESCYVADCGWSYAQCTPQGRERLRAALLPFRQRDIPTVYWLTRDVIHYENFRTCMADFDLVCVADPRAVDLVRRDYPDKQIVFLPPCVSAQMHNPFRWDGDNARILFDGWAELQERPERYDLLAAVPANSIDIVESRYVLHRVKLHALPDDLRARLRGCLTYAQLAWAARHYSVALEDSESFSSPLARHQKRLELLSCGLAIASDWTPESDLTSLLPADAPIVTFSSLKDALSAAVDMAERRTSPELSRFRTPFVDRLWQQSGISQRLSAIASALGGQEQASTRTCNAIFDASSFGESDQVALIDTFRTWGLGTLYACNTIPALQGVARKFVGHPRHFGSFWEASSCAGIDTILISPGQRPGEDWLRQLTAIKDVSRADVAVLTSSAVDPSFDVTATYLDADGLNHANGDIRPVAMLASSEKLPRRPKASDLMTVLFEICKSRKASVALAGEGLFGRTALR